MKYVLYAYSWRRIVLLVHDHGAMEIEFDISPNQMLQTILTRSLSTFEQQPLRFFLKMHKEYNIIMFQMSL